MEPTSHITPPLWALEKMELPLFLLVDINLSHVTCTNAIAQVKHCTDPRTSSSSAATSGPSPVSTAGAPPWRGHGKNTNRDDGADEEAPYNATPCCLRPPPDLPVGDRTREAGIVAILAGDDVALLHRLPATAPAQS